MVRVAARQLDRRGIALPPRLVAPLVPVLNVRRVFPAKGIELRVGCAVIARQERLGGGSGFRGACRGRLKRDGAEAQHNQDGGKHGLILGERNTYTELVIQAAASQLLSTSESV